MMSEKRFVYYEHKGADYILDTPNTELDFIEMLGDALETEEIVDKLNEQDEEIQRWKNLYELKDAEVTARVDALNRVCNYYLTEVQFKGDTDPSDAVKEVINEILNTPIMRSD